MTVGVMLALEIAYFLNPHNGFCMDPGSSPNSRTAYPRQGLPQVPHTDFRKKGFEK